MFRSLPTVVVGGFLVWQLAMPAATAQAGPFLDWLFGRPIYTYPPSATVPVPVVSYPTTVGYGGAPAVVGAPAPVAMPATTVSSAPVVSSIPTSVGYPPALTTPAAPCATCSPVTASYAAPVAPTAIVTQPAPATAVYPVAVPVTAAYVPNYRTSWYRVPVTYYRPVTAYQGVAVQPGPVMQPCNTYAWQVQQSPRWFGYRPWLPAPTPTYGYVAAPTVVQPVYGATPGAVFPAGPATSPAVTMPAVTMPAMTMPAAPAATMPSSPAPFAPPPAYTPYPTNPPASPGSTGTTPADQPPSLQLGPIPGSAMTRPSAETANPIGSGLRSSSNTSSSIYQVKPIPIPNPNSNPSPNSNSNLKIQPNAPAASRPMAPPLMDAQERDRSASAKPVDLSVVTPATWRVTTRDEVFERDPQRAAAPRSPQPTVWNNSGWKTSAGR